MKGQHLAITRGANEGFTKIMSACGHVLARDYIGLLARVISQYRPLSMHHLHWRCPFLSNEREGMYSTQRWIQVWGGGGARMVDVVGVGARGVAFTSISIASTR